MIGLSRLKRAIEDVSTGGMQTGDPKVRLKLCDAQRIEVEFNAIISERDSALAQNPELVAQVERLINFSNERIARASILWSCIEKVLSCEELVFNSEAVLIVNSVLADEIRCSLEDKTPAQCLRDVKAEAGRAGFVEGFRYVCEPDDEWLERNMNDGADAHAEKVRRGETYLKSGD